jgi:hypothetical protein
VLRVCVTYKITGVSMLIGNRFSFAANNTVHNVGDELLTEPFMPQYLLQLTSASACHNTLNTVPIFATSVQVSR